MDLVSIIIPCYNHEKYLERCLKSILEDSYENKEIIIVDDGSKDNSVNVIKKVIELYDTKKIIKFYTQENIGVVKTLNKLVDLANGKYIAIIASDDELRNDGIVKRINYLKNHSEKKAVIGNAVVIDGEDKILKENAAVNLFHAKKKLLKSEKFLNTELILQWSVVGPCLLLEKSVYNIIGKYNENYRVEDRDFYLRLIENNILGYLDETIAAYRVHGLNMSFSTSANKVRIECAKINKAHAGLQKKHIENIFLKSYKIDENLLTHNKIILYWINKLFRYTIILIYRNYLCFFA